MADAGVHEAPASLPCVGHNGDFWGTTLSVAGVLVSHVCTLAIVS